MALKEAIKENLYLNSLINKLPSYITSSLKGRKVIYIDSQSSIDLAKNPIYHSRTKHVDIRYHFVRDSFLSGKIQLIHHPTISLIADGLTKIIVNPKWHEFVKALGLKSLKSLG